MEQKSSDVFAQRKGHIIHFKTIIYIYVIGNNLNAKVIRDVRSSSLWPQCIPGTV